MNLNLGLISRVTLAPTLLQFRRSRFSLDLCSSEERADISLLRVEALPSYATLLAGLRPKISRFLWRPVAALTTSAKCS